MARDPRSYITVHNGMPEHPKVDPLSDAAFRALVDAWCLCSRTMNDGRIPIATWNKRWKPKARRELLESGLVRIEGDLAIMHDYLEHQTSAAEIQDKRAKRAEAGRKGGQRKAENLANGLANARANAVAVGNQTSGESVPEVEVEKRTTTHVGTEPSPKPRAGRQGVRDRIEDLNSKAHSPVAHGIAEDWARTCSQRPPGAVIAEVARAVDGCVASGFDATQIADGIAAWESSDMNSPTQIPHFVHRVVNRPQAGRGDGRGQSTPTSKAQSWVDLANEFAATDATPDRKELT